MELASYCLPGFEMALRLLENMYTPVTAYRYPSGKELPSVRSFMFDLYLSSSVVEIAQVIGFRVGRLRNGHSIPDITRCLQLLVKMCLGPLGVKWPVCRHLLPWFRSHLSVSALPCRPSWHGAK